jgi:hypothetical protein
MRKSIAILVVLCIHSATTKLTFEIKAVANPKIYGNFRINVTNGEIFNMTMDIMRKLESRIMVSYISVSIET